MSGWCGQGKPQTAHISMCLSFTEIVHGKRQLVNNARQSRISRLSCDTGTSVICAKVSYKFSLPHRVPVFFSFLPGRGGLCPHQCPGAHPWLALLRWDWNVFQMATHLSIQPSGGTSGASTEYVFIYLCHHGAPALYSILRADGEFAGLLLKGGVCLS